jgi:hypothetical protein
MPCRVAGRLAPRTPARSTAVGPQSESLIDGAVASSMILNLKEIPALFVQGTNGLRRDRLLPRRPRPKSALFQRTPRERVPPSISKAWQRVPHRALDWDEAECRCDRAAALYGPRRFSNVNRMRRTRLEQMLLTSLASCSAAAIKRYTTRSSKSGNRANPSNPSTYAPE